MKRKSQIISVAVAGLFMGAAPMTVMAAQPCNPHTQHCPAKKPQADKTSTPNLQKHGAPNNVHRQMGQHERHNGRPVTHNAQRNIRIEQRHVQSKPVVPAQKPLNHAFAKHEEGGRKPAQNNARLRPVAPTQRTLHHAFDKHQGNGRRPAENNVLHNNATPVNHAQLKPVAPTQRPPHGAFNKREDRGRTPAENHAQQTPPAQHNGLQLKPVGKGPVHHLAGKTEMENGKPVRRHAPETKIVVPGNTMRPKPSEQAQQPQLSPVNGQEKHGRPVKAGKGPELPANLQRRGAHEAGVPVLPHIRLPNGTPRSDAAAQRHIRIGRIRPIIEITGTPVSAPPPDFERPTPPRNARVLKHMQHRSLIEIDNHMIVINTGEPRLTRNARDVTYEKLPNGFTRVTVVRPDGDRIVTIRNRYGDIVRRSRITRDGHELVLIYVPDEYRNDRRGWFAPTDLPPPPNMPQSDYLLTARPDYGPERYYAFLERPPLEPIHRIYTLDEVRYSSRLRAVLPRIDLEIHFATGSATIDPSQFQTLASLARGMDYVLARNPAETFLIEGFTDTVGDPQSNLILSDERAESVAEALTQGYGIPPENLVTQGYGESELKVPVQGPEAANRRVAVQRITPLVAPVAQQ